MSSRNELEEWARRASRSGGECYRNNVKLYAPVKCGDDGSDCRRHAVELAFKATNIFGGSTVYPAVGHWIENNKMVDDPELVIEIGHNCTSGTQAQQLAAAVADYATKARQRYISVRDGVFAISRSAQLTPLAVRARHTKTKKR